MYMIAYRNILIFINVVMHLGFRKLAICRFLLHPLHCVQDEERASSQANSKIGDSRDHVKIVQVSPVIQETPRGDEEIAEWASPAEQYPRLSKMNPNPYQSAPSPTWFPMLPPNPPQSSVFWDTPNVHGHMRDLNDTLRLANAMYIELEELTKIKDCKASTKDRDNGSADNYISQFNKHLENTGVTLEMQTSLSVEAANALMSRLGYQLEQIKVVIDEAAPWEEKSVAVRFANKKQKSKRNKLWRKRKRKRVAETHAKERELFDQVDEEADEWRAREIAKDIAKRKVDKMKEISRLKAKEEKSKLESELELVLIVEKLQELRSIRIQKLKKQGHFLPEEDNKFIERVRAAVEEEERHKKAAADTAAAKDAIATAEVSRKIIPNHDIKDLTSEEGGNKESKGQLIDSENKIGSNASTGIEPVKQGSEGQNHSRAFDSVASLPIEFYHYYHGSNNDMGTLVEVRRNWDAYIRPGGSRIPGHWIQPPPPADEVWASYLVRPK